MASPADAAAAVPRESPYPMIEVADAIKTVLAHSNPLEPETVSVGDAAKTACRFAYDDVAAVRALPACRTSVMDGYALAQGAEPGEYRVLEDILAGHAPKTTVSGESCCYVTTGAPVPPGAGSVVPVEQTRASARKGHIVTLARAEPGRWIRAVGSDIAIGTTVCRKGDMLTPALIGALAASGVSRVRVHRRPRVGILSTGDELAAAADGGGGGAPPAEKIFDSNGPMLRALVQACGAVAVDLGACLDGDTGGITRAMSSPDCDIVVSSGGVSMGAADRVKAAMKSAGGTLHFGRMRMKPGKPTTFATVDDTKSRRKRLLFGLPGNPASCAVTFHLLVRAAILKLAGGKANALPRTVWTRLSAPLRPDPVRPEYHRVTLSWNERNGGGVVAESTGRQASSRLLSMKGAMALALIPNGDAMLPAGTRVRTLILGDNPTSGAASVAAAPAPQVGVTQGRYGNFGVAVLVAGPAAGDEGHTIANAAAALGLHVVSSAVLPSAGSALVEAHSKLLCETPGVNLVLLAGSVGWGQREGVVADAAARIVEKKAPALALALGRAAASPTVKVPSWRIVAGSRKGVVVVALPGDPAAVERALRAMLPVLQAAAREAQKC